METTFMETLWAKIVWLFGSNPFFIKVFGTYLVFLIFYTGIGALFTYVDVTGKPKFLMRYKIQENAKPYPITKEQLKELADVINMNSLITFLFTVATYPIGLTGERILTDPIPSFTTGLVHFALCILGREVLFYYSHRILHHPMFYAKYHKKHHTWTAPVALTSSYATKTEHLFSNLIPIFFAPMVLKTHLLVVWLYFFWVILDTLCVHSGYHLPFLISPEFHDFHHLRFNVNYGFIGLCDWLHGTDQTFREGKESQRHKIMLTTTPVKELIP